VATPRRYDRGVVLFHQGDDAGGVLLVVAGQVKVSTVVEGHEIILGFRGPGELLGDVAVMDDVQRTATATALEPVEALGLPASEFRRVVDAHPAIALAILHVVNQRLREADRQRIEYAVYDVLRRVARRLCELTERFGARDESGDIVIGLALSQDELAGWTGASREAVSKALHTLRELGCIETRRRRIVVRDVEALRRHAG